MQKLIQMGSVTIAREVDDSLTVTNDQTPTLVLGQLVVT
jgi:hypothetical protein